VSGATAASGRRPRSLAGPLWKRAVLPTYVLIVLAITLVPIIVMIVYSLNEAPNGRLSFSWQGFTTEWYRHLFEIPDLTSGFRGARASGLREFLHLLPNGFSTPTTTTLSFMKAGYAVAFEPIHARQRMGQSKIRLARDGAKFLMIIFKIVTLFSPLRIFLPISLASFAVGFAYMAWTIATQSHVTNSSVLLILFAVVVFLVGLVSEQISALRFEGRR